MYFFKKLFFKIHITFSLCFFFKTFIQVLVQSGLHSKFTTPYIFPFNSNFDMCANIFYTLEFLTQSKT